MLQRLQIEWMKLRPYKTFWILFILYLVSIIGINYIIFEIVEAVYAEKQQKAVAQMIEGDSPYSFPKVWHMVSYVASWLLVLPGLLIIISMSNEFNFKTHRQNIIDGWSRKQFISVKLAMVVIMAALSTIVVFLTALLFGFLSEGSFDTEKMMFVFGFFIQALSYLMTAMLFSLLFRRGGLAIGLFFVYIYLIDNIISLVMNKHLNESGRYLPLSAADSLVPFPVFEQMQKQVMKPYNFTLQLILALVYLGIYFFLAYRKFEKDDL